MQHFHTSDQRKSLVRMHKPCMPHSNDFRAVTEYKLVYIQMYAGNYDNRDNKLNY